jgi:hypothetical protein
VIIRYLNLGQLINFSGLRDKLGDAYEQIAGSDGYRTAANDNVFRGMSG